MDVAGDGKASRSGAGGGLCTNPWEKRQPTTPTYRVVITHYGIEFFCCPAFNLFCKNYAESKWFQADTELIKFEFIRLFDSAWLLKVADRPSFSM